MNGADNYMHVAHREAVLEHTIFPYCILKTELVHAIKVAKNKKTTGPDDIYIEYFKQIQKEIINIILKLYSKIFDTGELPKEWLKSTYTIDPTPYLAWGYIDLTPNLAWGYMDLIPSLSWGYIDLTLMIEEINDRRNRVKKVVPQGYIMSPMLFNLYVEEIFSDAFDDLEIGIKVNGTTINNIRYADYTVIIASNQQGYTTDNRLADQIR